MGDRKQLFLDVHNEYDDRIYRMCCSFTGNEEDRRDLHQEILTKIWRSLPSFRGDASVGTWVYRVAVNTSVDFLRARRALNRSAEETSIEPHEIADPSQNIESKVITEEAIQHLYSCLRDLPFIDRTIMSLYLEDVPYREIAEILGVSESNVAVRIHRAKKTLRARYKDG
jgi:RNA polymerase sigma-70 factor (ECF subfamily)